MKTILKQIKNEWNSNLFLFCGAAAGLCRAVVYCGLGACHRTGYSWLPMGFDTEHCYNITVSKLRRGLRLFIIRS